MNREASKRSAVEFSFYCVRILDIDPGLLKEGDISEKSLINIENGYNLPSLSTLKILSVALEVDFFELLEKLYDYIPIEK